MELTATVHFENGSYWAEVLELPGCFASGHTLDELRESLEEGVRLYLEPESAAGPRPMVDALRVGEMKIRV